ncbi:Epididymal-specific lipocalin-12 [Apodemus speciosus]|uniref:Epididymal-specific lipocalin-12 n=1 Tax=Apodemus speciosus TaxID=105296 RepID=A0ABQ0EGT5_APOSI
MLSPGAVLFFTLLLTASSLGQRTRKPYVFTSPISTIQAQANFSAQQEEGHRAEATTLHAAPQGAAMAVSTFRKLDGICWQVRQLFGITGVPGHFLLQVHVRVRGANLTEDQIFFFPKYAGPPATQDSVLEKNSGAGEFQGEWFVLALADNTYKREHRALLNFYITLLELKGNSEFQVTNSMTRGKRCNTWSYTLIPTTKPGQFTRDNRGSGPGADKENIQVIDTDYVNFALVLSFRQTSSQSIKRVSLLGRNWRLPHKTIDRFICLTKILNLTKDNFLFPDLTGNGFACTG